MPRQEPLAVVALLEGEQGLTQLLDRGEVLHPEELFFQGAEEALAQPLPSGSRTKARLLVMPSNRSSAWKRWLMNWLP